MLHDLRKACRSNWSRCIWPLLPALLLNIAVAANAKDVLDFGVYTSDKPTDMIRQFRPVIDALEVNLASRSGRDFEIRIQVARTYEEGVDKLVKGEVDFARFGPASYVMAKEAEPALRIIAMELQEGKKYFHGVICVKDGGPLQNVTQLGGRRFAFGNERSTIGRYLSQLYLLEQGIHARDLKHFDYLPRHDLVGTAVAAGRYDAGALKEGTFNKLVAKGERLKSIATFRNVTKPWVASAGMDTSLFEMLQQGLVDIDDPDVLKSIKKDGFSHGQDSEYDSIREAIDRNSLFFE